jgi:SSS family transporter
MIGVSFVATYASTNSYIGNAGKGYAYGVPWLLMPVFMVIFTFVSWRFVAPRLRAFVAEHGALTLPDFLVARYPGSGVRLRVAAGGVIAFASLLYLIAIFKGAGNLFEIFLGMSYRAAILLTLIFVVLYTAIGGFVSVVRTDFLQGLLMLMGAAVIFGAVTHAAGGVGSVLDLAARADTAPLFSLDAAMPFVVLLGILLAGSLKVVVDPRQLSRFYGLRDAHSVRQGLWVAVFGIMAIQFLLFPIGLYAHLLLDGVGDTDLVVPSLIADPDIFPPLLADALIVAIVAAAMSSMDSVLLVMASVIYRDLVEPFARPRHPLVWTRVIVIASALLAAGLALNPPAGIVEMTIFSGSLYAVCFLPAVVFGLYSRRGAATAVLGSMAAGVLVLLVWLGSGADAQVHELLPALAASTLAFALLARPQSAGDELARTGE